MSWPRIILHADMDAFYAAIEVLDRPELRGKPVIVGHPGRRGVVSTASYEARVFGVGSAMSMVEAMRRCPQGVVVPPRFARYQEISSQIMEVFGNFSPMVEPLSLDEAFLDMTGSERLFGSPEEMGRRLKISVREATGLTVSVGAASTKYVAKVASDIKKPDGLTVVPPEQVLTFLHPLPVRRLWGVGPKAEERLLALGLSTIGDVARWTPRELEAELGGLGEHIAALSRGHDPRVVETEHQAKSVGHEETLEYDIRTANACKPILLEAADRVAERLRAEELMALGVRVKLKSSSFQIQTRQRRLVHASNSSAPLYELALELLSEFPFDESIRLVGLAAAPVASGADVQQGDLFTPAEASRQAQLDRAVDRLKQKFGDEAVRRASALTPRGDVSPRSPRRPKAPGDT